MDTAKLIDRIREKGSIKKDVERKHREFARNTVLEAIRLLDNRRSESGDLCAICEEMKANEFDYLGKVNENGEKKFESGGLYKLGFQDNGRTIVLHLNEENGCQLIFHKNMGVQLQNQYGLWMGYGHIQSHDLSDNDLDEFTRMLFDLENDFDRFCNEYTAYVNKELEKY